MRRFQKFSLFVLLWVMVIGAVAQNVELTFTGRDSYGNYVRLRQVDIQNQSRNWTETLTWPDTTLLLINVTDIVEPEENLFPFVGQNVPNPFDGVTELAVNLAESGPLHLAVYNVAGMLISEYRGELPQGVHRFRISVAKPQACVVVARSGVRQGSVKILNNGHSSCDGVEYAGNANFVERGLSMQPFVYGDQMSYTGTATISGHSQQSVPVTQVQNGPEAITLIFNDLPTVSFTCGTSTLTDIDGNTYNTVQIGSQCWMKENLRTKKYADGTSISQGSIPSNTAYWCYPNNSSSNMSTYGLLYNWPAVMGSSSSSSTNPSGVQGICPTGWHVPSDAEWTQLTDYVSSQSQYVCGSDNTYIAKALAGNTGWRSTATSCAVGNDPGSNNATGFSALPAGIYIGGSSSGDYYYFGDGARFWSATEYSTLDAYNRNLGHNRSNVARDPNSKTYGYSVRCLRDEGSSSQNIPTVTTSTVSSIGTTSATCGGNVTNDGGATITARGVCWSTSQNPTVSDSHTTDGSGTGAFTSSITGLTPNTTYYVRAYATNSAGTGYGEQRSFTTASAPSFICGISTLTDIDGNTYNTVQIGSQCWMKENMRASHYQNGTAISPYYSVSGDFNNGYLYTWTSMMGGASSSSAYPSGVQGICPTGWHVPSDAEWTQLTDYVSSQSGYLCSSNSAYIAKALAGTTGWYSINTSCAPGNTPSNNNATGFSALAAGDYTGGNNDQGYGAHFWSATEYSSTNAYVWGLSYSNATVSHYSRDKSYGCSVRCLRSSSQNVPTVTTSTVSFIGTTSATCGGNVTNDGGETVVARGVCWSTGQNPTVSGSHTTNGSGTGSFTSSFMGLTPNTTYYVRAYATNSAGTGYGEQRIFTTASAPSFTCGTSTLTDIDGNTYNTVRIGRQCWMKENLRTKKYADGTPISQGSGNSTTTAYWYYPNGSSSNMSTYGLLYNWPAVIGSSSSSSANPSGVQGICPVGWHVPSNAEWTQLTNYVSSQSQYVCGDNSTYIAKALAGTTGWYSIGTINTYTCAVGNTPSNNNATGFSALPAGRYIDLNNYYFGYYASFWSATKYSSADAYCLGLDYGTSSVDRNYGSKSLAFSVRCLRDEGSSSQNVPTVTTSTVSSIGTTSATCGGNVTYDGGLEVTACGICWSTNYNPTLADNHTIDGSGMGSFTSSITGLTTGMTYYVRAYATNSAGTGYGEEVSFTPFYPCPGHETVTDIDGNTYNTVQIGSQCWMKENLRTKKYADGTPISQGSSTSTTTGYWYYPNNGSPNMSTYGLLYDWPVVMGSSSSSSANPSGVQGICPTGWHVPSDAEWTQLTDYVSSQSQYVCDSNSTYIAKALAGTTGWNSSSNTCDVGNTPSNNNATGFSALPAGRYTGSYSALGYYARFWSATEVGSTDAYSLGLDYGTSSVGRNYSSKIYGSSVRCLRDEGSISQNVPTVTTSTVFSIGTTSATCGGNVTSDGGAEVSARGVCWSTNPNPTIADSHTTNGSGTGSFSSSITSLVPNTTYYVRAYATNSAGTAYGSKVGFTTTSTSQDGQPCPVAATLTDIDGNTYNTVQIGSQCWMKENLRTQKYADGTPISRGSGNSTTTAYWYYPYGSSSYMSTYGLLYNWPAVIGSSSSSSANPSGVQGICPTGWHVPSDAEWTQLTDYVSSQNQYVCGSGSNGIAKALAGTTGWNSSSNTCDVGNDRGSNNATGFSALPAGSYTDGSHPDGSYSAGFWSATEYSSTDAYSRTLGSARANVSRVQKSKTYFYSVRCLRDEGSISQNVPTVTTSTVSSISTTSATCGGNVTNDGGATVTARGVCWSTSQNPTISDSHTNDSTGTGSFTSSLTWLTPNTTYYVRAYATNSAGTGYGEQKSFTTASAPSFTCGSSTLIDIDGNTYNTVQIGSQCWMKENLRTKKYADGTSISHGSSTSYTTGYWYYPNNSSSNMATYGLLYNWPAVMGCSASSSANPSGVQGICPTGWHVPSDAEWKQMEMAVGMSQSDADNTGYRGNIAARLCDNTGWTFSTTANAAGNLSASDRNLSGFSALPAGYYYDVYYDYYKFGYYASFWSAFEYSSTDAYYRNLYYDDAGVYRYYYNKCHGLPVRCLRDEGSINQNVPTVTTSTMSSIGTTSATCGGNVTNDGGMTVTAYGVCWSTSQNPTVEDANTTDGTGLGSFTSSLTGLTPNTTYYVRAYATNSAGTGYGEQKSFTTAAPSFTCGSSTLTDIDGNIYGTVQIGSQCWMKENLRTKKYADGTSISQGSSTSYTTAYWYYPNNSSSNMSTYGLLYNWPAVMGSSFSSSANPSGVQGICPTGWHVPSDAEWTQLTDYVSSQSQYVCGSDNTYIAKTLAGTTGWRRSTTTCAVGNTPSNNNATGFSALPAGYYGGSYDVFGYNANFWSATEGSSTRASYRNLAYNYAGVYRGNHNRNYGFSVRCLRDEGGGSTVSVPTVTTTSVTNITTTTATCGGNVTSDGGANVTARGVCWSTSQNPTISDSHTNDGTGTGSFTSSITGLTPNTNTTYYVRAYATNSEGTGYGEEVSFTTTDGDGQPCPGTPTLTDIDGNTYNTVQIGIQCWMKENLRTKKYANGTTISQGSSTSTTTAYWFYPDNNSSNMSTYGLLYNWKAVMYNSSSSSTNPSGVQGICPTGWHVPSDAEWTQLTNYVSSQSQYVCGSTSTDIAKALAGTTGWNSSTYTCTVGNTPGNNNATGFSALPAGGYSGSYYNSARGAYFWSASQSNSNSNYAWYRLLGYTNAGVYRSNYNKGYGYSVRCVRD